MQMQMCTVTPAGRLSLTSPNHADVRRDAGLSLDRPFLRPSASHAADENALLRGSSSLTQWVHYWRNQNHAGASTAGPL